MEIQVGVAKIGKYASSESGDTLEMVERPHGGLSLVLVDGQRSGRGAKAISNMAASKAISLLAEGVRDGAAARATHDYLYTQRKGKVSATLNIVSVDMVTKTLVISRNNHCPVIIQTGPDRQRLMQDPVEPIGVHRSNKPQIEEMGLQGGMLVAVFTDGIYTAGDRAGQPFDVTERCNALYPDVMIESQAAQAMADHLLNEALELDAGRPQDDMSIMVLAIMGGEPGEIRRMSLTLPVPPLLRP